MISVTSGEKLNWQKEIQRVDTPPGLASSIVGVAPVLDVRAVWGKYLWLVVKQKKNNQKP